MIAIHEVITYDSLPDELSSEISRRTGRMQNKMPEEERQRLREELSILNKHRMLRYWQDKREND